MNKTVEFYRHGLGGSEKKAVLKVLNSLFLTTGPQTAKFESVFAENLNRKYTVGLSSCTAALHLACTANRIGPGDEVITTPLSYVATATSILQAGAKPVFVDVDPLTGNINEDLISAKINSRTKAVLPVHLYGMMCDMKKISKLCRINNLKLIEDAAHCIEGVRDGIRPGELSDHACFSFYATKNMTCGEGGAITANSLKAAKLLKSLRSHGVSKEVQQRHGKNPGYFYDMKIFGWKYNLDDIKSSMMIPQIAKLDIQLKKRQQIAAYYDSIFKNNSAIQMPAVVPNSTHARHLYTIWVHPRKRNQILSQILRSGIGAVINYLPIHTLTYFSNKYKYKKKEFPEAERIGASTISLPMYPALTVDERKYVAMTVDRIVRKA
ncbi:MAG: DegT/DnrJ/EryC1/StrS family aminotransferase [Candidatus Omnitrophica bacterium]|nr:DegT/DnrJ/EryC1/StrS family aminotransferase [Candidatus Omnitrophota bacterium]